MKRIHLAVPVLLAIACCSLSSCIINANSHTTRSGKFISNETLSRIEPGKTLDYVEALIGQPSTKTKLTDGTEIWKWNYNERKKSNEGVFLVLDSDHTT